MRVRLNDARFPVTTLGPGRRIGVWFQGCGIGCPGCASRDTWDPEGGRSVEVDELVEWCRSAGSGGFDGVTISGGEPFEQPEALAALLEGLEAWRRERADDWFDLLCYSGFRLPRLRADFPDLLAGLDGLVAGPFVAGANGESSWLGSANQELVGLSERGRALYGTFGRQGPGGRARLQFAVGRNDVTLVGLPAPGDLERLEANLAARGVVLKGASWQG